MKKRSILLASGVAATAAVLWLLLRPSAGDRLTLETAPAVRIAIRNSVTATGTVEPVTEVEVGTQVSGIIDKLYADYNDVVKAGQLIAEMDKVTLQAELESAQAELAASETEYEYQLKNYTRTRTLHEKELVSDAEYDQALYLYEKAHNAYRQSQASIVKVKRNLGYATITSPIDGVVISRAVEEGQTVAAGFETPTLFTIANDLTRMRVIADVDEADIGQVADGQRVEFTVDAYPDDTFAGTVEQVRLEATTESSVVTYEVVITAHNPELKLKPGLTANVTVYTLEKEDALAVPTKALRFVPDKELLAGLDMTLTPAAGTPEPGQREIWVRNGRTLEARMVTTGAASGDKTEVTANWPKGRRWLRGLPSPNLRSGRPPPSAAPSCHRLRAAKTKCDSHERGDPAGTGPT